MSYCKFSSNGYQSDLHAYFEDQYTIHVASKRYKEQGPVPWDHLKLNEAQDNWEPDSLVKFNDLTEKFLSANEPVPIGLPDDDESFYFDNIGDFRSKMRELIYTGYQIDEEVMASIDKEVDHYGINYKGKK